MGWPVMALRTSPATLVISAAGRCCALAIIAQPRAAIAALLLEQHLDISGNPIAFLDLELFATSSKRFQPLLLVQKIHVERIDSQEVILARTNPLDGVLGIGPDFGGTRIIVVAILRKHHQRERSQQASAFRIQYTAGDLRATSARNHLYASA